MYDYRDAYIVVKETIFSRRTDNDVYDKKLAFKNKAPFISRISKFSNTFIDNAKDLDIVMPIYNLLEYSKNHSKTSGRLWNYYRNKPSRSLRGDDNDINHSIKNSKSFDYKTSIRGKLEGGNRTKNAKIVVSLKYLSNFWRTLYIPLINIEVSLALTWTANCVLTSKATEAEEVDNPAINNPTNATFKITYTKLYVSVVTL